MNALKPAKYAGLWRSTFNEFFSKLMLIFEVRKIKSHQVVEDIPVDEVVRIAHVRANAAAVRALAALERSGALRIPMVVRFASASARATPE